MCWFSHISDFMEGLSARAIMNSLDGNWELH